MLKVRLEWRRCSHSLKSLISRVLLVITCTAALFKAAWVRIVALVFGFFIFARGRFVLRAGWWNWFLLDNLWLRFLLINTLIWRQGLTSDAVLSAYFKLLLEILSNQWIRVSKVTSFSCLSSLISSLRVDSSAFLLFRDFRALFLFFSNLHYGLNHDVTLPVVLAG